MSFPRINLHIHSNFSDGKNSIPQIIQKSIELNLDYIAITDHYTNSWKEGFSKLKSYENLSEYLEEITRCQNFLKENQKKLILLKGLEIDLDSTEQFINQVHPFWLTCLLELSGLRVTARKFSLEFLDEVFYKTILY